MGRVVLRRRGWVALVLAAVSTMAIAAGPARSATGLAPTPGSPGLGDPFFPLAGNGGYDVSRYALNLDYDPGENHLDGTALIVARTTQDLSRFDLDLRGFTVARVLVNALPASFTRDGQELIVTPRLPLRAGRTFTVLVRYAGVPEVITDPDESIEGWVPTSDGAFVVGEPQGAPGWFPANDNPQDKAAFDLAITVPDGITAMGNGVLLARFSHGGHTTWVWHESDPMAPYLATATNGRFELRQSRTSAGIPVYTAVDPSQAAEADPVLEEIPDIVDFFTSLYGPYPFNAVGAIVDDAPDVGYALESQTKPNFDQAPDESTLVHELSHQWFGDSLTLAQWPDIWLHEGFATWSEWIWDERHGGPSAQEVFDAFYARPETSVIWEPPPADVGGPENLFSASVYVRGAMTLQALRTRIGDQTFFGLLRDWYAQHRYGNATTAEFIALAKQESGQDLDAFFTTWLYTPGKPALDAILPAPASARAAAPFIRTRSSTAGKMP
jgi:aminopeptidase N